jgi:hypothetical protein
VLVSGRRVSLTPPGAHLRQFFSFSALTGSGADWQGLSIIIETELWLN